MEVKGRMTLVSVVSCTGIRYCPESDRVMIRLDDELNLGSWIEITVDWERLEQVRREAIDKYNASAAGDEEIVIVDVVEAEAPMIANDEQLPSKPRKKAKTTKAEK